ncbi:DUF2059 domain-containing protein [Sneathiella sp.]|uniref:DUF2059 domain-containing protein n=1 Tax=Sneathiella sp. TaxID=1964365 RepID=UPI002619A356|nr:DUF2059 domain-containing protein [Sneathiella sp.]MDF2366757.1 DUF2059 domain-containing protein [Sneathiella sp.]
MTYLKRAALGFCLLLALGLGTARADTAKQEAIVELLKVTKTAENVQTITANSLRFFLDQSFKSKPGIPDEVKEKTYEIMRQTFEENLSGLLIPIVKLYEEAFSLEEIQELTGFYRTELGQKLIETTPVIMQKSMAIGGQWGQKVGIIAVERIRKELASKGYDI